MHTINRILYKEIRENTWGLVVILILMFSIVGFDVISPWPFKVLIDNVLSETPLNLGVNFDFLAPILTSRDLLGFLAVLVYFMSNFALSWVTYAHSALTKSIIKKITARFSKDAFKNLQTLAIGFYKKQQIGDYVYRLSYDVSAIGEFVEDGILPLITSGLYLVVTVSIMFLINVNLTVFSMIALPFLAVGLYSFNVYIAHATKRSEFFNSATFSFIEEALTHLKVIQAFSQERRESKRFGEKTETSLKSDTVLYRLDLLLTLLIGVIIAVSYSIIILYGIRSVFAGTMTTGLLVVFIFYLDNLTTPILNIIDAVTAARESYIKISRMGEFFSKKTHLDYREGKIKKLTDTGIKFDHVNLIGDKNGKKILNNVSFEIEDGKHTVIFGANGSGKTSVVNLIMRFIDAPTTGNIYLGGINLEKYDVDALRGNIAFVPQEITLFNETIRANIAFGNQRSSFGEIREAARLAAAEEFIKKLPGQYNFKVGEVGNLLSGGQRQRLMLARALLKKDAKILLFDETLSALDVKGRREIMENLFRVARGKTMILVSNIFDVVRSADNVIVLNKGEVVYAGPTSRLPREVALYKIIVDSG